ncbi:hypothetical protein NC651_018965 [Populus alba x Populus x berolinensis]|nr:hypothetical protein NC651_018965 [Populus alba x Populus x berolinensis]
MGASLGVKNKKKEHTWKDDMVLLLKERKNICFANKIHKRLAIVVNVSFQLGFFFLFFSTPTTLFNFSLLFFPLPSPPFFWCLEVVFYRRISILL